MARKKTKACGGSPPYTGRLAEPLPFIPPGLDPNKPPPWFEGSAGEWRQQVGSLKEDFKRQFCECLKLICDHHGVDPRSDNLYRDLALALLQTHVPAFDTEASMEKFYANRTSKRGQPTRLDLVGTLTFLAEAGKLRNENPEMSERQLARELSKLPQIRKLNVKEPTIRNLLLQMKKAGTAYKSGKATEFQMQLIEDAIPFLAQQQK